MAAGMTWERSSLCVVRDSGVAINLRSELGKLEGGEAAGMWPLESG